MGKKVRQVLMVFSLGLLIVSYPGGVLAEKVINYWNFVSEYEAAYKDYYTKVFSEEFQKLHPDFRLNAVTIPYEGSDAKYIAAFSARINAPDMFVGKVPYFAGGLGVADPAPADLQRIWGEVMVEKIQDFVKYEGKFYGWPLETDLGMTLFYSVDLFKQAGLDPESPPTTLTELLEYAKKPTKYGPTGVTQAGFALRYSGNPRGIADKWLPFLHAFGGRLYGLQGKKASGYLDAPAAIESLQFYGDLVNKYKVSSVTIGKPMDAFSRGRAAMIYRESWVVGWLDQNAPDINYRVAPLCKQERYPGISLLFTQSNMVYKFSPYKDVVWDWMRFITTKQHDVNIAKILGTLPVFAENFKKMMSGRPDEEAVKVILENPSSPYYEDPFINEIAFRVGEAVLEVLFNKKTAEEALKDAAPDVDVLLARKELIK